MRSTNCACPLDRDHVYFGYNGLYNGIDLHTFSRHGQMKYEFHVSPGSDYTQIELSYAGIEGLSIAPDGSLHIATELGEIVDEDLYIYQVVDGEEVEVAGRFTLLDNDSYSFDVSGPYDPALELVIDPNLEWSTYLGGSDYDRGTSIAVDASGNVLVTGYTDSPGCTFEAGCDTTHNGYVDAFVAKLVVSFGGARYARPTLLLLDPPYFSLTAALHCYR
ncbi:MAG: SBBP repeat-containing protein [Planctomycetota bacterium]|nr:SBBP repeat-containing protein [Planctomycetota bacterium]